MNEINKFPESHIREVTRNHEKIIENALRAELKRVFKLQAWQGVLICELDKQKLEEFINTMDIVIHQTGGELKQTHPMQVRDFEYSIEYEVTPITIKIYKRMV